MLFSKGILDSLILAVMVVSVTSVRTDLLQISEEQNGPSPDGFIGNGCPNATAISPCVCVDFPEVNSRPRLDCTLIQSEDELQAIFEEDFPVTEFASFEMRYNDFLTSLNVSTNGVSFEIILLQPGPFSLSEISEEFLTSSADTLGDISIYLAPNLVEFPFSVLDSLEKLEGLYFAETGIANIPKLSSDSLATLFVPEGKLSEIAEGKKEISQLALIWMSQCIQLSGIQRGIKITHMNYFRLLLLTFQTSFWQGHSRIRQN